MHLFLVCPCTVSNSACGCTLALTPRRRCTGYVASFWSALTQRESSEVEKQCMISSRLSLCFQRNLGKWSVAWFLVCFVQVYLFETGACYVRVKCLYYAWHMQGGKRHQRSCCFCCCRVRHVLDAFSANTSGTSLQWRPSVASVITDLIRGVSWVWWRVDRGTGVYELHLHRVAVLHVF